MAHMVIFRTSEGKASYHQAEALDDAVRFVEHLSNSERVTDARIFRMEEVPIEVKTYYRVEVGVASEPAAPAPSPAPAAEEEAPATEEPVSLPAASGNGHRFGLFGKS